MSYSPSSSPIFLSLLPLLLSLLFLFSLLLSHLPPPFQFILLLFLVCVYVCVHMCTMVHVWKSEDNCGSQLSSSTMWILGMELRLSRLGSKHQLCLPSIFTKSLYC